MKFLHNCKMEKPCGFRLREEKRRKNYAADFCRLFLLDILGIRSTLKCKEIG